MNLSDPKLSLKTDLLYINDGLFIFLLCRSMCQNYPIWPIITSFTIKVTSCPLVLLRKRIGVDAEHMRWEEMSHEYSGCTEDVVLTKWALFPWKIVPWTTLWVSLMKLTREMDGLAQIPRSRRSLKTSSVLHRLITKHTHTHTWQGPALN